jgi:5-hydroxyisourate hydrolase-like protein (transthyretin family)
MLTSHLRNSCILFLLSTLAQPWRLPTETMLLAFRPSGYGAVRGKVVDELGKPLSGVKVYAEPVKAEDALTGKLLFVTTNENGDFTLEQVVTGENVICASKEEAFYPDTGAAVLATDVSALPRVHVEEGKVTPSVTVRISKGGKLIGSILDSLSGQPVKDSRIRLTRGDDPRLYMSTGPDEQARFEFVVPSKPFRLEVTASGYKTWRSDDHGGPILAEPESTKEFSIRLQRISGSAQK